MRWVNPTIGLLPFPLALQHANGDKPNAARGGGAAGVRKTSQGQVDRDAA